jgi:hypothetical protein
MPEESEEKVRRKPGPVPGPANAKVTILLEPEIRDWGMHQPGGLSDLVRRLLREEKKRQEERAGD